MVWDTALQQEDVVWSEWTSWSAEVFLCEVVYEAFLQRQVQCFLVDFVYTKLFFVHVCLTFNKLLPASLLMHTF